jgi:hypothetical protein
MVCFVAPGDSPCWTEEFHPDWALGSLAGLGIVTLREPVSSLLPVLLDGSRYGSQLGLDLEMVSHCPVCRAPLTRREAPVDSDLANSGREILRSVVVLQMAVASPAS